MMVKGVTLVELLDGGRILYDGKPLPDGLDRRRIIEQGDRVTIFPPEVTLKLKETGGAAELYPDRRLEKVDIDLGYEPIQREIISHHNSGMVVLKFGAPDMGYAFYTLRFAPERDIPGSVESRERKHKVLTLKY